MHATFRYGSKTEPLERVLYDAWQHHLGNIFWLGAIHRTSISCIDMLYNYHWYSFRQSTLETYETMSISIWS